MTQTPEILCNIPCPILVDLKFNVPTRWICGVIFAYYGHLGKPIVLNNTKIAKIVGFSPRTVSAAITALSEEGVILVEQGKTRRIKPNPDYNWNADTWERSIKLLSGEEKMDDEEDNKTYEIRVLAPDILAIIQYWNGFGKLKKVELPARFGDKFEMTPKFKEIVHRIEALMHGALFNLYKCHRFHHGYTWSIDEIKKSIDNYYQAATDDLFYPMNKKTYLQRTLKDFILNPFVTDPQWNSTFLRYLEPPRIMGIKNEKVESPGLFDSLKEEVNQVIKKGAGLTELENMKLIIAANRVSEVVKKDFHKYMQANLSPTMWAGYMIECALAIARRGDKFFSIFDTLRQEWFYAGAFPEFLVKKGILSEYHQKKL